MAKTKKHGPPRSDPERASFLMGEAARNGPMPPCGCRPTAVLEVNGLLRWLGQGTGALVLFILFTAPLAIIVFVAEVKHVVESSGLEVAGGATDAAKIQLSSMNRRMEDWSVMLWST